MIISRFYAKTRLSQLTRILHVLLKLSIFFYNQGLKKGVIMGVIMTFLKYKKILYLGQTCHWVLSLLELDISNFTISGVG